MTRLIQLPETAGAITAAFAAGRLHAVDVAHEVLRRCRAGRPLNAITSQDGERLLAAARMADERRERGEPLRLLEAAPVLVKDNIDTCDYPTSAGTPALARDVPRQDAGVVGRLREAGALIAGKANLYELALGGDGTNRHFGDVGNPWGAGLSPGGSSSGSAAAVAARLVPAALGTDTNGSVRIPASHCGIAGYRPSFQRYPGDGIIPPTATRDSVGILATCVADLHLLDQALAGERYPLPVVALEGLRLSRPRGYLEEGLDAGTREVLDASVDLLRAGGATVIDIELPGLEQLVARAAWVISGYEVIRDLPGYLLRRGTRLCIEDIEAGIALPLAAARFRPRAASSAALAGMKQAYDEAMAVHRPRLQEMLAGHFRQHGVAALVYATTPVVARPAGADAGATGATSRPASLAGTIIQNTLHQSVAGIPSLTVPAGLTAAGLPVGLGLDGPVGSDARLLGIARAFELLRGPFPAAPGALSASRAAGSRGATPG